MTTSPPVTVGELFPSGDLVAQWMFSLSAVAEDLSITEAAFQDVLHADGGPLWTGYHYRQVIARLYEAERAIISARQLRGKILNVEKARRRGRLHLPRRHPRCGAAPRLPR